jgi:hypothetical protein
MLCQADSIGTTPIPPNSFLSGFGSGEVYRGETFRLPSGSAYRANSLTFFVSPTTVMDTSFRVLVTDTMRSSQFHPAQVLFESGTLSLPLFPLFRGADTFVVNLEGLVLQPDHEYAWLLDYFVSGNTAPGIGMDTGMGRYADGSAFVFPNGGFLPGGTRQDHFASNGWLLMQNDDMAFQLDFTPAAVPESGPATLLLFGLVIIGLPVLRRGAHVDQRQRNHASTGSAGIQSTGFNGSPTLAHHAVTDPQGDGKADRLRMRRPAVSHSTPMPTSNVA